MKIGDIAVHYPGCCQTKACHMLIQVERMNKVEIQGTIIRNMSCVSTPYDTGAILQDSDVAVWI